MILAGGLGTRLAEQTEVRPKPMFGIDDFVICLGHRSCIIREYFANLFLNMSDVTVDLAGNRMKVHRPDAEPWRMTLVDTGEVTQTGGHLKRVQPYVADEDAFCFTYGDGFAAHDIAAESTFTMHRECWQR